MVRLKLHAKFLFLILGSLVIFLGILSYVIIQREANLLAEKADEQQHFLAFTIYADLKNNMLKGTPRSTLALISSLRGTGGLKRLLVVRKDGSPAFGMEGGRVSDPRLDSLFAGGGEVSFQEQGDAALHTILFPLKNDQDCRSCHRDSGPILGALLISLSREGALREIRDSTRHLALIIGILTVLVGGVLYLVIRRVVLRPLAALSAGADRIGRGDLSHRIFLPAEDELQDLAKAFNVMTARLEESHSGLEENIRERTAQLQSAMDEIQDKAGRLYSYGRDMATISRLSTKIFNAELSRDELLDRFMWGVSRGLGYQKAMFCQVDRRRVWIDVKRNSGLSGLLPAEGLSLLSSDPIVGHVRQGKVAVLDGRTLDPLGYPGNAGEVQPGDIYLIPLLNRALTKTCWQLTSCTRTDCPAYQEQSTPCWLMDDTRCGNPLVESYGDKFAYCMTCPVFPVAGVLMVASPPGKRSSRSRNVSVLRILAAEMAAALENQRLHEANQRMVRELLELHRVTAAALSDLSLSKALDVYTESALKFTGLDACAFWLATPDGQELVRRAGGCVDIAGSAEICPERLPVSEGLIGRAFQEGSAFIADYSVPLKDTTAMGKAAADHGLQALLAVPLRSESGPLGVLSVHKRSTMPFLDTEIAAFMLLANQAAMAINVCVLNEELKNQNRELARQSGLVGGILSGMSSGILLIDRDSTVTLVNEVGAAILRSRREDLLGRRLADVFPETVAFMRTGVGPSQETEIRLGDGTDVPIGFSSTPYRGATGEAGGIIVVYRDLSEIKTLRAELLNKERFAAMGRVVSGVAHEIRNPLFGISSVGQILERELQDPSHLELIRALLAETKRMNQLVEELLLYGRPMQMHLEHCSLAAIWQEVIGMHRGELERRGIGLDSDPLVGQVTAYLDANQIRQVFLNLLRNSIDATRPGGRITIRMLLEDRFIVFRLADTGVGIPQANLDKIFDLFFTTKPKGTGLGLAICKKIVQDHGGDIAVASEEGTGTAVTVKLPYRGTTDEREGEGAGAGQRML
jgi:signal transduction histidine kinase/HAMP domain-containing protein